MLVNSSWQIIGAHDKMLDERQRQQRLTPLHYFSHGTPSMLGEESDSADYWERCGKNALKHGVKHIIIMAGAGEASTHSFD